MLKKRVVAIIQARMDSTRLPGKVLKKIGEKTILEILITRLRHSKFLDDIIIATTIKKADNEIVELSRDLGVKFYRGSEEDVLGRYVEAATLFQASVVVRVTADNPLTDPKLVDEIIKAHLNNKSDYTYCNNVPMGVGVEIINISALEKAYSNSKFKSDREHVTTYIKSSPELFEIYEFYSNLDNNKLRLTVDTKEDLELMNNLYERLGPFENLKTGNLINFLEKNPEISDINKNIKQITPNLNSKEVKLSVIIRSHNSESFIGKAIGSALNQTLPNELYEILVVDDGSTDNTKNLLKRYRKDIRVVEKKNLGPVKAINTGIKESKGKYFILLDSDDTFESTALAELLTVIEDTNSEFAYSDYYEVNIEKNDNKLVSLENNIFKSVAGGILFNKSTIEKLNGYDEDLFFPEYDLIIRLMKMNYKHIYIKKPLFTYLRRNESLTANKNSVKKGFEQLFNKYGNIPGLRRY